MIYKIFIGLIFCAATMFALLNRKSAESRQAYVVAAITVAIAAAACVIPS